MAISKRTRYEVLRRDNHTCRYCGGHAPDVVLTIDHVVPRTLGGSDDPSNLVAACKDCNAGKSSSNPDATMVAQVGEDAIRWARAIQRAVEEAAEDDERAQHAADVFWEHWHRYWLRNGEPMPLAHSWREHIVELAKRPELTDQMIADSVAATADSRRPLDVPFHYFLGVVRNKIAKVHERAREIVGQGSPTPGEVPICSQCGRRHPEPSGCYWMGYTTGYVDCSIAGAQNGHLHPDHYQLFALSKVVDAPAHAAIEELHPTYTGRV